MSKLESKRAFGEIISSNMKIGDLVSWSEWEIEDSTVLEKTSYGTIVEKIIQISGNRPVSIIKVACSRTGNILELNPFQIRIKETI